MRSLTRLLGSTVILLALVSGCSSPQTFNPVTNLTQTTNTTIFPTTKLPLLSDGLIIPSDIPGWFQKPNQNTFAKNSQAYMADVLYEVEECNATFSNRELHFVTEHKSDIDKTINHTILKFASDEKAHQYYQDLLIRYQLSASDPNINITLTHPNIGQESTITREPTSMSLLLRMGSCLVFLSYIVPLLEGPTLPDATFSTLIYLAETKLAKVIGG